jgi:hypothetical protein
MKFQVNTMPILFTMRHGPQIVLANELIRFKDKKSIIGTLYGFYGEEKLHEKSFKRGDLYYPYVAFLPYVLAIMDESSAVDFEERGRFRRDSEFSFFRPNAEQTFSLVRLVAKNEKDLYVLTECVNRYKRIN